MTTSSTVISVDLDYRPRLWQRECHKRKKRFTVLALHRRAGKTELAIMQLIDSALRCKLDHGLFVYMAPFLKQAKLIAWDRIKRVCRKIPYAVINESELTVTFPNEAQIKVFGGDNPDALRGVRLDGAVIDEVAQIKPEVWNEIVRPALSDRKGWALFIGTPKGINLFSELYYRAQELEDWYAASYTVYDTDALDPEEVERLRRDMPDNDFRREYLCDFSAAADDQLLSIEQVTDASRRRLTEDQYMFAPIIMGVDPARFGDDRSVIQVRQGLLAHEPMSFQGIDNMALAARVVEQIQKWKPDAVFIDVGNGSGVIDRVRQLGHDVTEVNFGGKAVSARYFNHRTEMYFSVRDWINAGGAIPNHERLKRDLATPLYEFTPDNKIRLEPKDEIKKRLLYSPDFADALVLTFAFPVAPKKHGVFLPFAEETTNRGDYDPFAQERR